MGIIRIGDATPSLLRLGDVEAYEAYAGDERVWPGTETKLWLHLTSNLRVTVSFSPSGADVDQIIDWGDGVSASVLGFSRTHDYAGPGEYCIRFRPPGNSMQDVGYGFLSSNIFVVEAGGGKTDTSPELARIEIGGLIRGVASYTFAGCTALTCVTIPRSVLRLGLEAFKGCAGLVLAEIGAQRLGRDVLKNCPALQKLWLRAGVEDVGADTLRDIGPTGPLTIYCEADAKPDTWPEGWNPGGYPVVWAQKARPW